MNENYQNRIAQACEALQNADAILIGGAAGLSTSGGLNYGGERFQRLFPDFIERYGLTDMYSSAFYAFPSQEERWAYWSRHIAANRYDAPIGQVYYDLLRMVRDRNHFVLTTNGDAQFFRAGFDELRVFATQGDYAYLQCATPCHDTLYDNEAQVRDMVEQQHDFRVPTNLIPKCPNCGGAMKSHLRIDATFIENADWHAASQRYVDFVNSLGDSRVLLLELGVGYNTPSIIKYPFERITATLPNATLIRINRDYPEVSQTNETKTITFSEDIAKVVADMTGK